MNESSERIEGRPETTGTQHKKPRKLSSTLFKKGQSGNPNGRPKGSRDFAVQLLEALSSVEREKGLSILTHAWRRAYEDDKVMVKMLDKLIPDRVSSDGALGKIINIIYPSHWNGRHDSAIRTESTYEAPLSSSRDAVKDF